MYWITSDGTNVYNRWDFYYSWALPMETHHAWVLNYHTCAFYRRCPFNQGACLINKIWAKTKTIQVQLLSYQIIPKCSRLCKDSPCQMLLRDLKTYPWCILYSQLLSRLSLIMLCISKNLIPPLHINSSKIFEKHGRTKILTKDEITCFHIL